jgi:hypothetical protein
MEAITSCQEISVTGFIRGIFRSKPKADTEPQEAKPAKPQPQPKAKRQPKAKAEAYYLDADDAKTYGDIDFMRKATQTRRTFPKNKFGDDNAFVQAVSSIEKLVDEGKITQAEAEAAIKDAEVEARRRSDSSMDMFRNMARDIRKR